ncbi:MAG: class I SAM-dependent methyltransferase [Bdellovibrionota bacterium]
MENHALSNALHFHLNQGVKFIAVTHFLIRKFFLALWGSSEGKRFFTQIYRSHLREAQISPFPHIKKMEIDALFPTIDQVGFRSYLRLKNMSFGETLFDDAALMSNYELSVLCALVRTLRPDLAIELGTFRGWSAANIFLNLPDTSEFVGVDVAPLIENKDLLAILQSPRAKVVQANTRDFKFKDYNAKLDFILIDAGHEFEDVSRDTENAFRVLSPSGTILWHDLNEAHPGVVKTLVRFSQEKGQVFQISGTGFGIYSRRLP